MKYIIIPRKYLIENLQVILHKNPIVADITSTQILLQIQRHKRKGKYTAGLFRTKSITFPDHIIQRVSSGAETATSDILVSNIKLEMKYQELEHQSINQMGA